jgi:hypothetical protein
MLQAAAAGGIFTPMSDVTHILSAIEQGDPHAAAQLLPLVYDDLRRLAAEKMAKGKPGQTLEATALVHEAYLRLVDVAKASHWDGRGHFFAAAEALGVSPGKATQVWAYPRTWLREELADNNA